MPNIQITTEPTGRSPENKYFFGSRTSTLDFTRPKYNKVGEEKEFWGFWNQLNQMSNEECLVFYTANKCFRVKTNDKRHAQFIRNMFTVLDSDYYTSPISEHMADWIIIHNTEIELDKPKIYVHLDENIMLIGGTTFMGEIKKGVFSILGFELPEQDILPMHCAAFTSNDNNLSTNLMFGLSGTGKTTLSSDPDFSLISDDEVIWKDNGIEWIEQGCYAKSEGLSPETHKTIFDAVEIARQAECLVEENPGAANARLCYPLSAVENSYADMAPAQLPFDHPDNIFFLTMDATGSFPSISKISGDTVRMFFETGYTSQMPGTEAGSNEIKKILSPCYGSPFMPKPIKIYSDMLMNKIKKHNCNVYLVNTGMDPSGKRYSLDYTRSCIKTAIDLDVPDRSEEALAILKNFL